MHDLLTKSATEEGFWDLMEERGTRIFWAWEGTPWVSIPKSL